RLSASPSCSPASRETCRFGPAMATWGEFEAQAPELAETGRRLLYQFGVGLAFLATVRADGGPRVHPMCPVIHDTGLYAFIIPSPKREDLLRDGRYAMHSFPGEHVDDEFYVAGRATPVTEEATVRAVTEAYHIPVEEEWMLFELSIERA